MATPPPPDLRLSLLGRFEVAFRDEPLTLSLPAQKLVAHLAVTFRGRPASRAPLAESLWPETGSAQAAANLRSVLWRLPRPRGRQLVQGEATTVRLAVGTAVDIWEGHALAARLQAAEAGEAPDEVSLELLAEDLLPHWDDHWLVIERENYRQQRLHALEHQSENLCHRGRFVDALQAGLGAVQSDPLRESAHRRVIEVHLAEGNQADALRQYHGYRRLLADELGLRPSPAMCELVAPLPGRPVDRRPVRANQRRSA